MCSGNHDSDGPAGASWLLRAAENLTTGRLIVDGSQAVLDDLIVSVVPYWNIREGGAKHHDQLRSAAEQVWCEGRQLADQHELPWALLHHEPPEGTPAAADKDSLHAPLGEGSTWCEWWIKDCRPNYVFSGHIHRAPFVRGGSWAARFAETGTWCFNPGRRETGCCLVEVDTTARRARWFRTWGMTETGQTLDLDAKANKASAL